MVTQFWSCPNPISDRVITCLEPWAPPLASWQAVIVGHYIVSNYCQCQFQLPFTWHAPLPLYGTYYHYSGLGLGLGC